MDIRFEDEVIEIARLDAETGKPIEDYEEFSKYCKEDGIEPTEQLWNIYLSNYEDFNEEIEIDSTYHDCSEDELIEMGVFGEEDW